MSHALRRSDHPATPPNTVAICISGNVASVANPPRTVLDGVLSCVVTRFEPGGPLGHRHDRARQRFWREGDDGTVTVPTGLVPRLTCALCTAGYHTEVEDLRHCGHVGEGGQQARDLLGAELVEQLVREPRGLIEAIGRGADDIAAGVARLYPAARVLVVARNRRQARATYRRLRQRLREQVGHGRELDALTYRVVVVTLPRLAHATRDDFGVVVALDALAATRRRGRDGLIRLGSGRLYGCVPPGVEFGHRDQLTLKAAFGPVLHRDPAGGAYVGVRVAMAIPPWSPPVMANDALARKRSLWSAAARNRFVADVGRAIAVRSEAELCRLGLVQATAVLGTNTCPRVAILVESPEHGRFLSRLLPGWRLITSGDPDAALTAKAIVTLVAAAERESLDVDVLVGADGGTGPLRLKSFPPRRLFPRSTVLVVDVADDFDRVAIRNTEVRIDAYEGRGWPVVGRPNWPI